MAWSTGLGLCAARGLRLVGYSRPGYGESDRHEGGSVGDCACDVATIADSLGAERLYVIGHSGGGAHALACPALLGERVLGAAVIACAAPRDAEGLDWLAGPGVENVEEYEAALIGGETLRRLLDDWAAEMLAEVEDAPDRAEASEPLASLGSLVSNTDRASITPAALEFGAARRKHSLAPGIWGWYDDDIAETKPWGFDLQSISRPVAVWHGGQDASSRSPTGSGWSQTFRTRRLTCARTRATFRCSRRGSTRSSTASSRSRRGKECRGSADEPVASLNRPQAAIV